MTTTPLAVTELARELSVLGWVTELLVGGSLATGDYVAGVSDLDLVALAIGPIDAGRIAVLKSIHHGLDRGVGSGQDLGCVYVDNARLDDTSATHPTWTHGSLVNRHLSGIARAELVLHGFSVFGRSPLDVLPAMTPDDVRQASRDELAGYWTYAARHASWWLDPVIADLGLTSMARGRHAIATGELITKTRAIEEAYAPNWLIDQLRARRRGEHVVSPRLRTGIIALRDARRTVAQVRH